VTLREARAHTRPGDETGTRLAVRDLVAGYRGRVSWRGRTEPTLIAVNEVSFEIAAGHCLAVVGESGSGKTTLARCIAGLHDNWTGEIAFQGTTLPQGARERVTAWL